MQSSALAVVWPSIDYEEIDWSQAGRLTVLCVIIQVLWHSPVIDPLKLLVVFLHELSHAIVGVATGGRFIRMEISADEGGLCVVEGGNRFLFLSAGYLGSLIWGGLVLLGACWTSRSREISICFGVTAALVGLIFVRPLLGFGLWFSVLAGLMLLYAGLHLPKAFVDILLQLIGLTSCLYVVPDLIEDMFFYHGRSDATMLADLTDVPAKVWGALWVTVAFIVTARFLMLASVRPSAACNVLLKSSYHPFYAL